MNTNHRRVELPVLCKFLRCKSSYGAVEDDVDWRLGTAPNEVYWCLATMEVFSSDDSYAHATVRGCCRRE